MKYTLLQPKSFFPFQSQHQSKKFYGCVTTIILLVNHRVCLNRVTKFLQLSITEGAFFAETALAHQTPISPTHLKNVGMKS